MRKRFVAGDYAELTVFARLYKGRPMAECAAAYAEKSHVEPERVERAIYALAARGVIVICADADMLISAGGHVYPTAIID
jgi:hypothetical protein